MNVIDKPSTATRKQVADRYGAMGTKRQAVALARLANRLSVMARETYGVGGGIAGGERLRAITEAQNRVVAQLERLLTSDPQRYPDDVFANILCDQFENVGADAEALLATVGILEQHAPGAASRRRQH